MTADLSHVPRRLRRFYRHNMPVPEELAHIGEKKTEENANSNAKPMLFQKNPPRAPPSPENEGELHEPWMDATPGKGFQNPSIEMPEKSADEKTTPFSRRDQRRMNRAQSTPNLVSNAASNPLASLPQNPSTQTGMFSRVLQSGNAQPTPMDHALGLQQKQQFENRLPSAGEKVLQRMPEKNTPSAVPSPGNPDLANTLNELRRLAAANPEPSKTNKPSNVDSPVSLSSFHFTPVEGAPNPVNANSVNTNPSATPESMSPRQRMEMRRMRTGTSGFGAAGGGEEKAPGTAPAPAAAASASSNQPPTQMPAHIRRRMGRVLAPGEEMDSGNENPADEKKSEDDSSPFDDDEAGSMKDLLGDEKEKPKKKKVPSKFDDDDLSLDEELDEDIAPLDDEK